MLHIRGTLLWKRGAVTGEKGPTGQGSATNDGRSESFDDVRSMAPTKPSYH